VNAQRRRRYTRFVGLVVGACLVIAGVAAVYWPAALILAGVLVVAAFIEVPGR
jgi:uncharacterized membrane protein HdeD (DUF308 family)